MPLSRLALAALNELRFDSTTAFYETSLGLRRYFSGWVTILGYSFDDFGHLGLPCCLRLHLLRLAGKQ